MSDERQPRSCAGCVLFKAKWCHRACMQLPVVGTDAPCTKYIPVYDVARNAQNMLVVKGGARFTYDQYDDIGKMDLENRAFAVVAALEEFAFVGGNGQGIMSEPARRGKRCGDCALFRSKECPGEDWSVRPASVNYACDEFAESRP